MRKSPLFFVLLSLIVALIIATLYQYAGPIIMAEEQNKQDRTLAQLLGSNTHYTKKENFELLSPEYLHMGDTQTATRLYDAQGPHMIVIKALAKGYSGNIGLLISLDKQCTIGQVEIVSEHETPGLGDQYKHDEGTWLQSFSNKNNQNTKLALKRQGGDFDAWSGATVTPQGIVQAVNRVLNFCEKYHASLFSSEPVVYAEN